MGEDSGDGAAARTPPLCVFLCGDVMLGRGIDQILPHPGRPQLFEPYVRSAKDYVTLAERATGKLPSAASYAYPWGDALDVLAQRRPHARIINLETAVTTSDAHWPDKAIHYRMHRANLACLTEAGIDCCVLANNHVLDWGRAGLDETLRSLHDAGIRTTGAVTGAYAPSRHSNGRRRRLCRAWPACAFAGESNPSSRNSGQDNARLRTPYTPRLP